jgi:hypothetical protein
MRLRSKLSITFFALLLVAATSGCSEASSGATVKSERALIGYWTHQVLADIGATMVRGHSTTFIATNSCGDWTSRFVLANLTVTVPFYQLESALQAIVDGQKARGWDTSAARSNASGSGNVNGGTIRPANAGFDAGMSITGGPSSNGESDLQITMTSACFAV